ncbi:hypothetical protein Tco_0883532 [Tanacetum coccineum]
MVLKNTSVMPCFKTLNPWTNKVKLEDRLVWLSIEGLPPHAWHEATFSCIASSWGYIIVPETCNSTSNNLVAGKVYVRTKCMNVILHTMPILVDDNHMCIRVREIIGEGNVLLLLETSSNASSNACSSKSKDENDDYDDKSNCEFFIEGLNKELENGGGWIEEEDEEHIGRNGLSSEFDSDGVDYVKSPEYSKTQGKLPGQPSSTVVS